MASEEQQQKIFKLCLAWEKVGISRGTNQSGKSFSLLNYREHM